ncbi:MAG: TlpA disulfide reductase family protein [Bacteroidales bacterium]
MKRIPFLVVIVSFLLSACSGGRFQWTEGTLILAGKIDNLDKHPEITSLALETYQLTDFNFLSNQQIPVNSDGTFHYKLNILQPQAMFISPGVAYNLLVSPGDSLFIHINAEILDDSLGRYRVDSYVQVDDPANSQDIGNMNRFISEFYRTYNKRSIKGFAKDKSPVEFAHYLDVLSDSCSALLARFTAANHPSERFTSWAADHLRYSRLEDLMRYRTYKSSLNGIPRDSVKIPDSYYDFLQKVDPADFHILSVPHLQFLHEYLLYCMQVPKTDMQRTRELFNNKEFTEGIRARTEMIRKNTTGTTGDLFLARFLQGLISEKDLAIFDSVYTPGMIRDPYLDARVQKNRDGLHGVLEKKEMLPGINLHTTFSATPDVIFDSLASRYSGKLIYVGLWAPWDGRCIAEMQASRALSKQMAGKDIVFVYLGGQCREDAWKGSVNSNWVAGEHYLLRDKQFGDFVKKYQVEGIPHYFLLGKDGKMINQHAPAPSQREEITKAINELLGENPETK